jgi:hypothetical protein
MAAVHILEDLESVLFLVDIEENEYNAVFDHIVGCVDSIRHEYAYLPPNLTEHALDFIANVLFKDVRNITIATLRKTAWDTAQMRKKLRTLKSHP